MAASKQRSRSRHKGRRESGLFTLIPHAVQDCPNWKLCGGSAIKLLMDMARQYNGRNNGNLCASLSVLRHRGWSSPDTLNHALKELRHYGFIILTRQGGLHSPSLYALSWYGIDDCGGKLTCASPTLRAPGTWKNECPPYKRPPRKIATT